MGSVAKWLVESHVPLCDVHGGFSPLPSVDSSVKYFLSPMIVLEMLRAGLAGDEPSVKCLMAHDLDHPEPA